MAAGRARGDMTYIERIMCEVGQRFGWLLEEMGLQIATSADARSLLGLKGPGDVGF